MKALHLFANDAESKAEFAAIPLEVTDGPDPDFLADCRRLFREL
ncbi:MAG TPA: hypothetical protein VFU69_01280 [Ktedonobacterales bacterium]|nr:hypothetical protein [Ktedonobacterales bacterium]